MQNDFWYIKMVEGIPVLTDRVTNQDADPHKVIACIEAMQNTVEALKRENKILAANLDDAIEKSKSREQMNLRAIQGLGGVIHSIELRHLCVLAAAIGQASIDRPIPHKSRAESCLEFGFELYNQITMNESQNEFQDFTGEDKSI